MALVTVRAAAERLGVGYSTLKRWVHTGRVRTTRTEGGHHRISDAEIDRLTTRQQPDERRRVRVADPDESLGGLSARNRLHGFIEEVRIDGLLAQVRLRVGDQRLTAVITADAVHALKLRRGNDAMAIIKSTEVMIAIMGNAETKPKGTQGRGNRRPADPLLPGDLHAEEVQEDLAVWLVAGVRLRTSDVEVDLLRGGIGLTAR